MNYRKLDRKTGKTTGAILAAISEAYNNPGLDIIVDDRDMTTREQLIEITQKRLHVFIDKLELRGFSSGVGPDDKLVLTYTNALDTLVEDENGTLYYLKKVYK